MLRATRNSVWQLLKQSGKTGGLLDQQKDHSGHSSTCRPDVAEGAKQTLLSSPYCYKIELSLPLSKLGKHI
jgi:hypothetical protein